MRRGLVFTLMNMYFLLLLLTVYVSTVVSEQMPALRSYLGARSDAATYWILSEFNAYPLADRVVGGGCILVPQIRPYNENLPDGTTYDDLNVIAPLMLTRRCS